jgi:hypothetical protein
MTQSLNSAPVIIVREVRSVGIALLLTFLFGPLGMLYSTISGALIMIVVSVVLGIFTLGLSLFVTWPISMVWGAMAASSHNQRVLSGVR